MGEIAVIYDEVRRFSGVPYASSLHRFLVTMPGVLEWVWGTVREAGGDLRRHPGDGLAARP
jgi:hypothetical protein